MNFELDDEQEALREVSRAVIERWAGPGVARSVVDTEQESNAALWSAGAEIGWLALTVPEEHDGLGQGLVEMALVSEELGRGLATGPVAQSALIARLLAHTTDLDSRESVLPSIIAGERSAVWALAEPNGSFDPVDVQTRAIDGASGVRLSGVKTVVEAAAQAEWIVVTAAEDSGEIASFLVRRDAAGVRVERELTIDETRPRYRVHLTDVPAACRIADAHATKALSDAATLLTIADALGAAEKLFEMTTEYVKIRRQFDRQIGSFQAVKHALADMLRVLRGSRAALYYAAMASDAGDAQATLSVAVAKAYASEGLSQVAGQALQLHGGIGFTWEHDLHLYLRRIKANEIMHGDSSLHRDRVLDLRRA